MWLSSVTWRQNNNNTRLQHRTQIAHRACARDEPLDIRNGAKANVPHRWHVRLVKSLGIHEWTSAGITLGISVMRTRSASVRIRAFDAALGTSDTSTRTSKFDASQKKGDDSWWAAKSWMMHHRVYKTAKKLLTNPRCVRRGHCQGSSAVSCVAFVDAPSVAGWLLQGRTAHASCRSAEVEDVHDLALVCHYMFRSVSAKEFTFCAL